MKVRDLKVNDADDDVVTTKQLGQGVDINLSSKTNGYQRSMSPNSCGIYEMLTSV